jgi:hypothetical protein
MVQYLTIIIGIGDFSNGTATRRAADTLDTRQYNTVKFDISSMSKPSTIMDIKRERQR